MGSVNSQLDAAVKSLADDFFATTGLECAYSVVDQVDGLGTTIRVRGKAGLQDLLLDNGQVDLVSDDVFRTIAAFIDRVIVRRVSTESVGAFIEELRAEGFGAQLVIIAGQVGVTVGPGGLDRALLPPNTIGLSFPLWELNEPQNLGLVARRDFHAIAGRRPDTFTFVRNQ